MIFFSSNIQNTYPGNMGANGHWITLAESRRNGPIQLCPTWTHSSSWRTHCVLWKPREQAKCCAKYFPWKRFALMKHRCFTCWFPRDRREARLWYKQLLRTAYWLRWENSHWNGAWFSSSIFYARTITMGRQHYMVTHGYVIEYLFRRMIVTFLLYGNTSLR